MFRLKTIGRTAVALMLGAGLYVSAGIDDAAAVDGPPPPTLIHSEGGFDFSILDFTDGVTPFEMIDGSFFGASGVLAMCPGCFDGSPDFLSITRPDGAPFSMIGLVGASSDSEPEPTGPAPADFPFGVDFAVSDIPDPSAPVIGVLAPGLFEFHFVGSISAPELFVFSPDPLEFSPDPDDPDEASNCLCFDSMTFLVDFGPGDEEGPIDATIAEITVTFGAAVPEPAAFSLLGLGLVGLALMRRRWTLSA